MTATFTRLMTRARTLRELGEDPHYRQGFERGLRRAHHGTRFGTPEEHIRWLTLGTEHDPARDPTRERAGRGYRDGLEALKASP